jgi:hypothetical protein
VFWGRGVLYLPVWHCHRAKHHHRLSKQPVWRVPVLPAPLICVCTPGSAIPHGTYLDLRTPARLLVSRCHCVLPGSWLPALCPATACGVFPGHRTQLEVFERCFSFKAPHRLPRGSPTRALP